ncbi:di-trans,poly-cis-decaprenylcistransferase [Candidatus Gottesmanbacteria bacterium]|nr:di-trans,poly-cis-decaprenylcistransferase [Candidatus Gottesmanbacteria bacterium]
MSNNVKDKNSIPQHVAIVMDGNRRWAKAHGLPVLAGHKKVLDDVLEPLIEHAAKLGVTYITFWAWSTENWKRDKREVEGIMKLFKSQLQTKGNRLHEKGIRVRIIGDISKFDESLRTLLIQLVEKTKNNAIITAVFALNYGGRDELLRCFKKIAKRLLDNAAMPSSAWEQFNNLTIEQYNNNLDTSGIPDPELIIRTGGEQRLSGFLLWQSEYSELYFPTFFMPEFTPKKLDEAIEEFQTRKRRFGV